LMFDGKYLNSNTVFVTQDNEWQIVGNEGLGVLHQEGQDLHISAQGYSGYVVVQGFFDHETFLNLALPEFVLPLIGETGSHASSGSVAQTTHFGF